MLLYIGNRLDSVDLPFLVNLFKFFLRVALTYAKIHNESNEQFTSKVMVW